MDNTVYSTLTNQVGILNNIQLTTNNMANAGTVGFKQDKMLFKQFFTNDVLDKTTFPNDASTIVLFQEGVFKSTKQPFDLAIAGRGFFALQTPEGVRYTRNGSFTINSDGTLINKDAHPVLTSEGDTIAFDITDNPPYIMENGRVMANGQERGNIAVVDFQDLHFVRKSGNNMFFSDMPAFPAENFRVIQGTLEQSNAVPVTEMARMLELNNQMQAANNMINNNYRLSQGVYKAMSKQGG